MKWYCINKDSDGLVIDDYPKDWFDPLDPDTFTNKKQAVAELKRRIKARIAELQEALGD